MDRLEPERLGFALDVHDVEGRFDNVGIAPGIVGPDGRAGVTHRHRVGDATVAQAIRIIAVQVEPVTATGQAEVGQAQGQLLAAQAG